MIYLISTLKLFQGCLRFRRLGALLRMDRSIQAEGIFGGMKYDRWYKRVVRRGLKRVRLELFLVSIGHNLYKSRNKKMRLPEAA